MRAQWEDRAFSLQCLLSLWVSTLKGRIVCKYLHASLHCRGIVFFHSNSKSKFLTAEPASTWRGGKRLSKALVLERSSIGQRKQNEEEGLVETVALFFIRASSAPLQSLVTTPVGFLISCTESVKEGTVVFLYSVRYMTQL